MPILHIKKHTDKYSIVHNSGAQDKNLTAKTKGVLWYLLTLPDDWKIKQTELRQHFKNMGRDALRTAIQELIEQKYIIQFDYRDQKGLFNSEYFVFECPQTEDEIAEIRKTFQEGHSLRVGLSGTDEPARMNRRGSSVSDNPTLLKTNKVKTEKQKTEKQKTDTTTTTADVAVVESDPFFRTLTKDLDVALVWFKAICTQHQLVSVEELRKAILYLQSQKDTNNPESIQRSLLDGWPFFAGYSKYEVNIGANPEEAPPPKMVEHDENIWSAALHRLEQRVNRPSFNTWLRPITLEGIAGGIATFKVPDDTFQYWLPEYYDHILKESIGNVIGIMPERLEFMVRV